MKAEELYISRDNKWIHQNLMSRTEHQADQIKNEIRANLPRRLFMAMDRRDMLDASSGEGLADGVGDDRVGDK